MGIKLTKQDFMRLSKERLAELLAELLAEMDNMKIEPISIPTMPITAPYEPWKVVGPTITYDEGAPNTNTTDVVSNLHAQ